MERVFISYSREDQSFVTALHARLTKDGFDCFLDRRSLVDGDDWVDTLEKGIATADVVIPVLSEHFCASEWALKEVHAAQALKKRLLPVLLAECDGNLPPFLKVITQIRVSTDEEFETNYPAIRRSLGGPYSTADAADRIKRKFGLLEVRTVDPPTPALLYESLGREAAAFFVENVVDNSTVGVSCGYTVYSMAKSLQDFKRPMGMYPISFNPGPTVVEVTSAYATLFEICKRNPMATAFDIPLPGFLCNPDLERRAFLQRPDISESIARAFNPSIAFYSVGDLGPDSSYARTAGYIQRYVMKDFDPDEFAEKACGEVNWLPVTANGDPVDHPIVSHCTAIPLATVKRLAHQGRPMVLVAGGRRKAEPILAALRGGYLSVLIVDTMAAQELMRLMDA